MSLFTYPLYQRDGIEFKIASSQLHSTEKDHNRGGQKKIKGKKIRR